MDDSKSLAQSFSIKLDPKAKVFIIDSLADLELAPSRRIGDHVVMDFEALAKKYDVIWLTEKGMWDTRGSAPGQPTTYGWDCETVYVMNPDVVKPV